jgi:phosphohistidine phosphatase
MKTLYLLRHAKSSWKYPALDDFERPLNKRGRRDAPIMGAVLKELKVAPDLILSSPANRAATTARTIAQKIDYPLEKIRYSETIYEFGEDNLIKVIQDTDEKVDTLMLVGHNPALTELANYVGDQPIGNIPTCGLFCARLDIKSWSQIRENCGKVKFFEYPKKQSL